MTEPAPEPEPRKPCPFCGQTNARVVPDEPGGEMAVECLCGARGPGEPCRTYATNSLESYKAEQDRAVAKAEWFWNRRVP